MIELFITDFIKNKIILITTLLGLVFELIYSQTLIHTLILFGLPYSLSILLKRLMQADTAVKPQAQISRQFKEKITQKITITPK